MAKKKLTSKEKLVKELSEKLPEIDEQGLVFLIDQANTLLHNQRVAELNSEKEKQQKKQGSSTGKAGTTARVQGNTGGITVSIEQSAKGKSYNMIIDGKRHFLTAEEMQGIVKLCYKPERKSAAIKFLYQFLQTERKDILVDHNVSSGKHPFFEALFYETRARFTLND